MRWSYGVTTVPERKKTLLPRTLHSLRAAGFDSPRLFVDGGSERDGYQELFGLPCSFRVPALRTAQNWHLAMLELYLRDQAADRFALFQDDFLICRGAREYLDRSPYPGRGYLNLFTFSNSERSIEGKEPGTWHEAAELDSGGGMQVGRGAVALVFSREAVMALLSSPYLVERVQDVHWGWRKIDGGIVTAMNRAGWREFVHCPSLVQHIGDISSMGSKRHKPAMSWPGEEFDARGWLKG